MKPNWSIQVGIAQPGKSKFQNYCFFLRVAAHNNFQNFDIEHEPSPGLPGNKPPPKKD